MRFPSLGWMVVAKRTEKKLTQAALARNLGIEPYRLSDLERGKVRWRDLITPVRTETREADEVTARAILDRLFGMLDFDLEEQGLALLLCGLRPNGDDIDRALGVSKRLVDSSKHPSYVSDTLWTLYWANRHALRAFGYRDATILAKHPNLLELALEQDSPVRRRLHDARGTERDWRRFLRGQIINFKLEHLDNSDDPRFQDLRLHLMKYDEFASHWRQLDESLVRRVSRSVRIKFYTVVRLPGEDKDLEDYFVVSLPLIDDQRFRIELYIPVDNVAESYESFRRAGSSPEFEQILNAR